MRKKTEQICAKLNRDIVWESNNVKVLGITSNNKLKFNKHVANICSKANRKLSTLTRVAKCLPFKKRLIIFKAFTEPQYRYCPLAWMFHGRQINDKINKPYESVLRTVYNDTITSSEELLVKLKLLQ